MVDDAHKFDRRGTDANLAALNVRMSGLEGRVEVLEHEHKATNTELRANTELTRQMHTKVEAMHAAYETATNGVKVVTVIGNVVMGGIEKAGKLAKPLLWIIALGVTVWGFFKTGHWNFTP